MNSGSESAKVNGLTLCHVGRKDCLLPVSWRPSLPLSPPIAFLFQKVSELPISFSFKETIIENSSLGKL
jgi:hypothetical protein